VAQAVEEHVAEEAVILEITTAPDFNVLGPWCPTLYPISA